MGTNTLTKIIGDRQVRFRCRTKAIAGRAENNALVLADGKNGAWTLPDLRCTGATMMQRLGISPDIIKLCQNHAVNYGSKVSKSYLHYDYAKEKAQAWYRWGDKIEERIKGD